MSAIKISATVKLHGIEAAARRLTRLEKTKVFREARGPARFDQNHHDRKEEGPDGHWPALHPSTIARYAKLARSKRRRSKPRKLLGRLPKALISIVTSQSLIVRSRVPWASAHQNGAIVGRGARLPRRQFLWISDWLVTRTAQLFREALLKAWRDR